MQALAADIFPLRTAGVSVLLRHELPAWLQEHRSAKPTAMVTPRLPAWAATRADTDLVRMLPYKPLKGLIRRRGWHDIPLGGPGRTREALCADVLAKLKGQRDTAFTLALDGNDLFAASSDLSAPLPSIDGWAVQAAPLSIQCELSAQVLQRCWVSCHRLASRQMSFGGYGVELKPVLDFKGVVVDDQPCVAILVRHVAVPPPELHLGVLLQCADTMCGLRVRVMPRGSSGTVVGFRGFLGRPGSSSLRDELFKRSVCLQTRKAIENADDSETCWAVRFSDCETLFVYIASQLRPALTLSNGPKLAKLFPTGRLWSLFHSSIVSPGERQKLVDDGLNQLRTTAPDVVGNMFSDSCSRVSGAMPIFKNCFSTFTAPRVVVGGDYRVHYSGADVWAGIQQHGLYSYHPSVGRCISLVGVLLHDDRTACPQAALVQRANAALADIACALRQSKFSVHAPLAVSIKNSVTAAFDAAESDRAHAVVFFFAPEMYVGRMYAASKCESLERQGADSMHIATQWVSLGQEPHNKYIISNIVLALCAKLGHTPYILDDHRSAGCDAESTRLDDGLVLCGLDVCHYPADHVGLMMGHMVAGMRLQRATGELEQSHLFHGRVDGESIPTDVLRQVISSAHCGGHRVVVHRDGRFTKGERRFLAQHARDIMGTFALVEVVKWAGGTPRLYQGRENPPGGTFLRLSANEGILTTCSSQGRGTLNPLLIRFASRPEGDGWVYPIERAAEDIFRLSFVNYASLWRTARLPLTTRAADAIAYWHAMTGMLAASGYERPSLKCHGRQQYWL